MPSLAHEGNPKEDEITITAGSVLSTAQLDILLLGGSVGIPTGDPDPLVEDVSSCSDVFEWPGINDGVAFMNLTDSPCQTSSGSLTRYADTTLQVRINSTRTCYGLLWQKVTPIAFPLVEYAAGASISFRAMFNGIIDGTPRAGIVTWIDDASTKESCTCFALVIDMDTNTTKLVEFANSPISNLAHGTVRGTMNAVPSIGQILSLTINQYPADVGLGSNGAFSGIWDSTRTTELYQADYNFEDDKPFDGSLVRHAKCGVGFISVGGETAGKMEFKHSADISCQNALTPFMIMDSSGGT